MAETNNPSGGGEATTNTTTVGSGRGTTGDTLSNTTTTTSGTGGSLASSNTKDAKLENLSDEQNPGATEETAKPAGLDVVSLPYPHHSLSKAKEGVYYHDLIQEAYDEHEKELEKGNGNVYDPDAEMLAARADAQLRLAAELRASLKAQRTMRGAPVEKGTVKIKLTGDHTHNGIPYEKNDEIMVDETSAKFIEEAKVGKRSE